MTLRVGSLIFAVEQGLGILARAFHTHGIITDVCMIRHGRRPEFAETWYPGAPVVGDLRSASGIKALQDFCASVDVMLFFETAFHWSLIDFCRAQGIKTVLMPMHECMPDPLPATPDLFLCPSLLDLQCFSWYRGSNPIVAEHVITNADGSKAVFLPIPVEVAWRQRERAEVFVHNAGWGGLLGRNGTAELLGALRHVKSPARFIIRSQEALTHSLDHHISPRVEWVMGTQPHEMLWATGDVCLFPERNNGLSLPLQEARAAGMLVMAADRYPMNTWLPKEPLIPTRGSVKARVAARCREFDQAIVEPRDIAAKIDEFYGADISEYSRQGKEWAESMSWSVLGPKYKALLENLL